MKKIYNSPTIDTIELGLDFSICKASDFDGDAGWNFAPQRTQPF
jgi:hypothetical protein